MSIEDDRILNRILSSAPSRGVVVAGRGMPPMYDDECSAPKETFSRALKQWTSSDGKVFIPASTTVNQLLPGAYEIKSNSNVGIYFEKIQVKTEGLVRFPDTNSDLVIAEITKFWDREHLFKEFGLAHRRGICLWGPPGSGKSCTIQFIMKDVIERNGIVVKFTAPHLFTGGIRILREIQPETPVVVLMEDIDGILEQYSESEVLNLLDGVDKVTRTVFLATTNYPELLGSRIINRPSRFDKRFYIGYPNEESRLLFFRHLVASSLEGGDVDKRAEALGIDFDKWVRETEEMSIAHLKELFVAVVIQGDLFEDSVKTLKEMKDDIRGDRDPNQTSRFGFSSDKYKSY